MSEASGAGMGRNRELENEEIRVWAESQLSVSPTRLAGWGSRAKALGKTESLSPCIIHGGGNRRCAFPRPTHTGGLAGGVSPAQWACRRYLEPLQRPIKVPENHRGGSGQRS